MSINAIARDTDGKIILAGFVGTSPSNNNFIVFRYFPDGRLDSVFGENGILITPFTTENNLANALLIQPDHKIIVAGTATIGDWNVLQWHAMMSTAHPIRPLGTREK